MTPSEQALRDRARADAKVIIKSASGDRPLRPLLNWRLAIALSDLNLRHSEVDARIYTVTLSSALADAGIPISRDETWRAA